jgi:3-dehydroquinate synthase class II
LNLALVNGNEEEAKIAANTLELGAKELSNGFVIGTNAAKITEAATIKEQRAAFSELSNALIVMVKETGLTSGEVYIDYCPMALNDAGGYWLSSEKGIKNPYFGDSMLTCGETKETLN